MAITFVGLVFHVVMLPGRVGPEVTPEVQTIFQQLQLLVQRPACSKQVGCFISVFSLL